MRITLHKYIFSEIWPTFMTVLMVFIFLIMSTEMLKFSEWVINYGVRLTQVMMFIFYLLPDIILFALPATTLMAVFVAFLRLSSSNEILAMKSSGISLFQMLPTVLLVSLISFLIATFLGIVGSPWGNRSLKDLEFQIAQSGDNLGIKKRVFSQPTDNLTFYVNSSSSAHSVLRDVFVVDKTDPTVTSTIVAKEARILRDPEARTITIVFLDGTLSYVDKDSRTMGGHFDRRRLSIGMDKIMESVASGEKDPVEMSVRELTNLIEREAKEGRDYNMALVHLLEKFSIPLAVFFMGIIGVPLGAQLKSGGRTVGIVVGLTVFLIYYMCLAAVRNLCKTGFITPFVGIWAPDLFLLISGLYLWHRATKERPIQILEKMKFKWESRRRENYRVGE
jgi:lipopolysaccharide export system permease protein